MNGFKNWGRCFARFWSSERKKRTFAKVEREVMGLFPMKNSKCKSHGISVRPIRIRPSASLFAGHACGVITECSRQPSPQLLAYASNGLPSSPAATLHCIYFFWKWMNVLPAFRFFFTPELLKIETTHAFVPCFTQRTLNCVAPLTVSDTDTDSDIPVSRALIHNHGTREEGSRERHTLAVDGRPHAAEQSG